MTLTGEWTPSVPVPFQRMRRLLQDTAGLQEGVVGAGDFAVSQRAAGANMSVDVALGAAWVQVDTGANNGVAHVASDAIANVSVTTSDATNPRVDQVTLRWNDTSIPTGAGNVPTLQVLAGTPTAGAQIANPSAAGYRAGAASLPNDSLRLADFLVPATSTSVTNANINDRRPSTSWVQTRGKSIIAASDSTSATTYAVGNLTTPDRVQGIVLPTDGLIAVMYQAIWQNTVANNAKASLFIGANQLKGGVGTGVPVVQEISGPTEVNDDALLFSSQNGLQRDGGVGAATEVTTGQIVGTNTFANGGPIYIFAAAGTYDVSVQFKNTAAGTLTVKNRHLWVWSHGF